MNGRPRVGDGDIPKISHGDKFPLSDASSSASSCVLSLLPGLSPATSNLSVSLVPHAVTEMGGGREGALLPSVFHAKMEGGSKALLSSSLSAARFFPSYRTDADG